MTELLDPKERSAIEWSMAEEWKIRGYRILAVVLQPRIHIAERVIVGIARNCAEVCPDCLQLTIGHICMQWPGHDLENRAIDSVTSLEQFRCSLSKSCPVRKIFMKVARSLPPSGLPV